MLRGTAAVAAAAAGVFGISTAEDQVAEDTPDSDVVDDHSVDDSEWVETGLGEDVDTLVNDSPTFALRVGELLVDTGAFPREEVPWQIEYGPSGASTARVYPDGTRVISIDRDLEGDSDAVARALAAAVDHAWRGRPRTACSRPQTVCITTTG